MVIWCKKNSLTEKWGTRVGWWISEHNAFYAIWDLLSECLQKVHECFCSIYRPNIDPNFEKYVAIIDQNCQVKEKYEHGWNLALNQTIKWSPSRENYHILRMIFMRCLDIFLGNIDFQKNYVAIIDLNFQNGLYIDLP